MRFWEREVDNETKVERGKKRQELWSDRDRATGAVECLRLDISRLTQ